MEQLLNVQDLTKRYESFTLDRVSFSLERGYIMGFIGRNGAGKTTTLKSMLNLVHKDGGTVRVDGLDFSENELACKQKIGFMLGGVDYYPRKRLSELADVTKRFYAGWDEDAYRGYLARFALRPEKRVNELSAGMRVKFSLALALSHHAELLVLDEPTSGLDPVSRDDLIELFQQLIEDGKRSILFSTHITPDLEKCADYITYIRDGRIVKSADRESFLGDYRLVAGTAEQLTPALSARLIGSKRHAFGFTGLIHAADAAACAALQLAPADLDSIMVYCDKEGRSDETTAL